MAIQAEQFPHPESPMVAVTGSMAIGGASTFLVNLAAGFHGRGFKLSVVVMSTRNDYRDELASYGARVVEIDRADSIYEDRIEKVYRAVALHRPRMVLSTLSPESFEILRIAPPGTLRAGMLQTDDPGVYGLVGTYRPWLDVVIGVSPTICDRVRAMEEAGGLRVECIPYGIRFDHGVPERTPDSGAPLRVVYVGRLDEDQKRISRIAAVIRRCAGRPMEFTVVGSGTHAEWFRGEVGGLPGVTLIGAVGGPEVQRILAGQDVFLLLSDFEGLPLALLEAMGTGVVPVVSDLESGVRDLVGDRLGIRVPVGDIDAAVSALERLAADPASLAAMGTACAAHARSEFTAERMSARYLALAGEATGAEAPSWPWEFRLPVPLCLTPRWVYAEPARTIRRMCRGIGLSGRRHRSVGE